ncbi:MAG TPA: hypothetical protein PKA20_03030 [Burkholderiaceae bacterium]|nr:hypothetical protein [Burkholderiaceae bacterium]
MNARDESITFAEVEEILRIIDQFPAAEVTYQRGDLKLHVRRAGAGVASPAPAAGAVIAGGTQAAGAAQAGAAQAGGLQTGGTQTGGMQAAGTAQDAGAAPAIAAPAGAAGMTAAAAATHGGPADRDGLAAVVSPLMGAFYAAPAPDAPPFVEVGRRVVPGDDLCIIEVMKVMNLIKAEVAGVVIAVEAVNAAIVERGQPLMWIRPEVAP